MTVLWRHPDFLRLWAAQVGSALGSRVTRTALPMTALLALNVTSTELAVLSALGVAPAVLVGLLVGGTVDRVPKRPLLIGADLVRAALLVTVPAAAWAGILGLPHLCVVAAGVAAATALFQIADNSFLPSLVGREHVLEGNAKLEATEAIAEAIGPGLAGVLVEVATAPIALLVDAASFLWSAALLSRIQVTEVPSEEPDATVLGDVRIGLREALTHVRAPLLAEAVTTFFGGFYLVLYLVLALEALRLSPTVVGALIGIGGIGAVAGAWLAPRVGRRAMVPCLAFGLAVNLLIPLSLAAGPWVLVVQQLLGDAFLGVYAVHALSLRQEVVPEAVSGRVNATFHVVGGGVLVAGALVAGPLADVLGLAIALWMAAVGALFAVLVWALPGR